MAEASLKTLKLKRGNLKSSLTRLRTFLDADDQNIDIAQIQDRQLRLQNIFEQFEDIQTQIEIQEDFLTQEEERSQFEDTYFKLASRMKFLLTNNDNSSADAGVISNQVGSCVSSHNPIKLPTIELPSFTGDYDKWFPFFDTFNSLIHLNNDISQVHKFQYLKSCLKGNAATVIHSLEISESNYNDAWKLLVARYDNKRLIVHKHIQAMHELTSATKESHSALRSILDGFLKHIRALTALKRPTEHWDDLLIYLLLSKLDYTTKKEWEAQVSSIDFPKFNELTDFLTRKCNTLETTSKFSLVDESFSNARGPQLKKMASHLLTNSVKCAYCGEGHRIYRCLKFLENTVHERIQQVKTRKLCYNCLQANHPANQCKSGVCKTCNKKHHTLLHLEKTSATPEAPPVSPPFTTVSNHSLNFHISTHILLSTAVIKVYDITGHAHRCRALLDSGSQSNLITKELATKLSLPQTSTFTSISGINQSMSQVNKSIKVTLKSFHNNFQADIECLLLDTISDRLPQISLPRNAIPVPKNLKLADPDFHLSRGIDILIGADLFFKLLCIGRIDLGKNQPVIQKTLLGWILSGKISPLMSLPPRISCNLSTTNSIHRKLAQFWELESLDTKRNLSSEEKICEEHFKKTHTRNSEGRFVVELPIKKNAPSLGNSRDQALKRFYALERRLSKQPVLKSDYSNFLQEYVNLGHMRKLSEEESGRTDIPLFYLPHHAVVKESSLTTKLRVVFDGSAKSSSGYSLNDTLLVGPKLQQDLVDIVARFRTHQVVFTADIAKMYRQVLINKSQTALQRILWRESENHDIDTFELTTVTYGTASASYLAIKSLQQLAIENQTDFPLGSEVILKDFYVDDLLSGADSVDNAKVIRHELVSILAKGGFDLRKWASNNQAVLETVHGLSDKYDIVDLDKGEGLSTLGLQWNPKRDTLQYFVNACKSSNRVTKRTVLSMVSQIFDPLGLVAPIIITAKIFIQKLWELGLNWDESLPRDLHAKWLDYENEISNINSIQIPRNVLEIRHPKSIELHGFCDASEQAYGACIYVRGTDKDGNVTCNLLCSKSRVAPLKVISLPRLELCGALLLAQLASKMRDSLNLHVSRSYYWTDSTIVLSWLKAHAKTWKTFVANRVSEIHDLTNISQWNHVGTSENPADILSRGISAIVLRDSQLWWTGPKWLRQDASQWTSLSQSIAPDEGILERRAIHIATISGPQDSEWLSRYSDFIRLIRITAYCQRFRKNLMARIYNNKGDIEVGHLTTSNLNAAITALVRIVQEGSFPEDIQQLQKNGLVSSKSRLLSLHPFIDGDNVLRVGGRLRHSNVSFDQKHQIILPPKHHFTNLVIRNEHFKLLHAGTQATLAGTRNKYWIIAARNQVKSVIRKCIICFRANPSTGQQIMGNLPASRTTPSRPFENVGIDYFGPLYLKEGKRKNSSLVKAYGVVFVCFATKATHLELAGDLTIEKFLSTLRRFISRRVKPLHIYSDNGTQFVGARRELGELKRLFHAQVTKDKFQDFAGKEGINWHFIPPRSPHFGGIWEAAVKAVKHHLIRVLGKTSLNYEEMSTLLIQIEAILNSRPLSPISNDPNDLTCLTPGHFLIGDSITAVPEPSVCHLKCNRLSRWQYIQQVREHFWKRWSKDYLNQLQPRNQWKSSSGLQTEQGKMVLLREDNVPPMHWPMGRIQETFPGEDGVVRVATVKTTKGIFRRNAAKLCVLPTE